MTNTQVTRIPACPVKYCPARKDPDFHKCWCGRKDIEHHDAGAKGMGGGKDHHKRPENIVALCHGHHEAITTLECSDRILDLPTTGRTYVYYDTDGTILHEQPLEAGSTAAESGEPARNHGSAPPDLVMPEQAKSSAAAPSASGESSAGELGVITGSGLVPTQAGSPALFSLETWCQEGMKLVYLGLSIRDATDGLRFAIGDWVNTGEGRLGEEVYGYLRGFKDVTVRQYSWVAGRVRYRVTDLAWSCHRAVAALEPSKQKEWLDKAREKNLTSKDLYREIHGEKPRTVYECPHCELQGTLGDVFRRVEAQ